MKIKSKSSFNAIILFLIFPLSIFISIAGAQQTTEKINADSPNNEYIKLQKALIQYREIAAHGGWPSVPMGTSLKKGDRSERVVELRKRLAVTGDFVSPETKEEYLFDEGLYYAVVRFQKRHGLKTDGVVGPDTVKHLNVPAGERISQIEINMKRLMSMSKDMGQRYIAVNIAAFELEAVENSDTLMSMKVIAGKPYWHTPVFSEQMTHIVFNPSWYVPRSIAVREILPKIKKDPDYLNKEGIKVSRDNKEMDIPTINWTGITAENFQYQFVQVPGEKNPLGKIKFVFPNRFNVYLHDTPAKVLFEKSSRAFSHGCIRIEKPFELAEYLLRDDPLWTRERILATIDRGKEVKVKIPEPININILYLTAWVNEDNVLQFRDDVYQRDRFKD
ncbi:MAG: L,D-transpeptidase family protein [Nitrospirae bacterium]|nr:L,D-transpeptidase family protein [Nitrospirota bacterium]